MTDPFSTAQCVGYLAFALGISAFLQKRDGRLKAFNSAQSFAYAVHFVLLGNLPAGSTAAISGVRSFLAIRTRSPWMALVLVLVNIGVGFWVGAHGVGWIPVAAGSVATVALFLMRGIALRLALFGCTLAWLANNWLSGSIGGVALETIIAVVNAATMIRLRRDRAAAAADDATDLPL
ncbi:YgjV family protein [Siculibacillus lacustris]|uniref:YgjV family protein n=1 Tax=Siculibacillus lacustris TaxID=1549641 RepID=A0A4Q9VUA7_9HYPH|nr:YgjV family protein [Siculibacillus lacustris]TBW39735.1 YgjV family protein [Siculibacillus lacustris]